MSKNQTSLQARMALDAARYTLYQWFSMLVADPGPAGDRPGEGSPDGKLSRLWDRSFQDRTAAAAAFLRDEPESSTQTLAFGELPPDRLAPAGLLAFLPDSMASLRQEHQQVFGLMSSKDCPPYETEYCPQSFSVTRSHRLADIAGCYKAFGLEPAAGQPERHDHIALELEFMGWLIAKEDHAGRAHLSDADEKASLCREAQKTFFTDHLAWWVPAFAFAVRTKSDGLTHPQELTDPPTSFYGALGANLAAFVAIERAVLSVSPPMCGQPGRA